MMATVSSHILDSTRGTSAAGIRVQLFRLHAGGKALVFDVSADDEGRVSQTVDTDALPADTEFELVFHGADYFAASRRERTRATALKTVVLRFSVSEDERRYHMPVMLSPHSYSVWSSA